MLEALADATDEEHDALGGYDPAAFDPKAVRLDRATKRRRQAYNEE